ncbi:MAG: chorismate-binding protein [Bdellovibrionales bacterium]
MKEGILLQISKDQYLLGEGPFKTSSKPCLGFYITDFFLKEKQAWLQAKAICKVSKEELLKFLGTEVSDTKKTFSLIKPPSFIEFQQAFYQIKNQIRSSKFKKMVPVFFEELDQKPDILYFLKNFYKKKAFFYQDSYLYGYWNSQRGLVGLSPEILFSYQKESFSTMALAGTSVYPGASLFENQKEMMEHQYVIQSIEESLKGLVHWTEQKTYEKVFGKIKHLCTQKKGRLLGPLDYVKLCHQLHPTAALGSYPKKEAFSWLNQEQKPRHFFGAPFGYFNGKDRAFCLVSIRNMEWMNSKIRIYSGAGIVRDSVLQKEWEELFLKRKQVRQIFL